MPEIYTPTTEDQQLFTEGQAMFDEFQAGNDPEQVEDLLGADEPQEVVVDDLLADDPVPASNDDLGVSKESITFAPSEVKGKGIIDGAKAIAGKIMDRAEELTVGQYKRGKQNERVGLLYNKFLQTGDETFKQEAVKLEQSMTEQPEMDSIPSKIVGYTSEQLPQFPGRAKRAVEEALDEDAGSQLELGDRVGRAMLGGFDPALRVAKAFLYDYNAEVMTGHAYAELDKIVDPENGKGIDEEIKQRFAKGIGALGGVVENASLLPLGRLVPGGAKVLSTAVTNGISAMLRSGALRGIAVKGAQVVGAEVAEEWTQQTAQWIGNEIAKHTMNELRGTNMPAEDITYLGKRLKDSFLPTIYASIGLAGSSTMMGMSVEGAAQLAGKKVLQAEAAYNMRLHAKQVDEDLTAANAELTDLRTSITESSEDMAYEDAIEDDLSVETASEDLVASEDIDVLQQRIDDLFVPRAEDTGYSLAEHRAVENALKEARLQRSANVREAEQLEMSGRADNARVVDLPTVNAQLDARINELSERAQGMRESQRRAAQRAIVSGQWDSHEEARTRAGKPMGVSKQEFANARQENAKGFQELRKTRQELNELRSQEKALEGSRESGKRRSPAQKALREKVKGLRSEMRAERLRLMDEKNNLDMMEGKVGSEVGKRLGDLRTDLKEAGTLGEKSFDASLPGLEREEILSFRNAIYRAWRDAKAAVTAGDREGYARGKEVIRALIAKQRVKQKVFRIQKQMVQGIKKMIRAGAKKNGRVDADTNALFAALRPLLTGKEITNIEEIVALADAGDFQAQISLRVLEMRERAKNRDFSFLKQLHDEILAVYLGGKEARQVELDTFRTQVNQSIEKITQEIRGPFDIRSRQSGEIVRSRMAEVVQNAMAKVPKDTKPEYRTEEILAYMISDSTEVGPARRVLTVIKQGLVKLGIDPKIFTVEDYRVMAEAAVRSLSNPKSRIGTDYIGGTGTGKLTSEQRQVINQLIDSGVLNIVTEEEARQLLEERGIDPKFMVTWHGSPHDHNKFSTKKIGTGEGAQAYGYGLYFSEAKDVAEHYLDTLSKSGILPTDELDGDFLIRDGKEYQIHETSKGEPYIITGKLYQVELAPAEDEYLLWDRPLSEQSEKVKAALKSVFPQNRNGKIAIKTGQMSETFSESPTGKDLYTAASFRADLTDGRGSDKAASEYLHSLGIRGIKYLDGTSRGKVEGAYNYVIFDENDIEITAKYAKNGKVAGFNIGEESYLIKEAVEQIGMWNATLHEVGVHSQRLLKSDSEFQAILKAIEGYANDKGKVSNIGVYIDNIKNFFSFFGVDFLYALQDTLAAIVQDSGTHFFDTEAFNVIDTQDAENLRDELQRVYTEEMVSIYAQAYGLKPIPGFGIESVVAARMNAEAISEREALTDADGNPFKSTDERNPDKFSFNISELRKLYMLIKNDRTRQHFIENQGFTDEVLDAVVRKVEGSPVDMAIVNGQFAIMETLYAKINKVYRKLNNYDLPKQEFYTHITREYTNPDDLNARTLADVMLGADFTHASTSTMSALQRRTASKLPIKIVPDVLDTMDYMRQMAHYIAFAEKSRLWNSVFRSQEFTKELREKYGDKFGQHLQSKLNRYIDDTIRGRAADNRFVWKRMETAMHYIVKLTLAAKAKIGLGQITSNILYLDQMEVKEYIAGLNEFLRDPKAAADFLDANSTFFKNRSWRTDQTLIKQFGDLQYGKNKKVEAAKFWLSETGDKLMMNVMIGDKIATYVGGYAMARALSKRMSLKAAIRKAETYTKLSQQSSTMSVQSSLQSGGTFERMAAMYSSQQFGMLRLQIRSLRDMFNAKGRYVREKARLKKGAAGATPETVARYRDQYYSQAKKTAKTQAIFQIASPMLFAWVTAGFDWDWPEQAAGLMGALNAIPVVGEVTEALVRMSLGLNKYGSEMVVTQFMNDIVKAGKDLVLDQDKVVQDTAVLLQLVSMGVPLKTIVGIMQGISDVTLEEKIHSGMLRTMGYSEKTAEKAANE